MAKKKRIVRKIKHKANQIVMTGQKKFSSVIKNLILFVVLTLFSWGMYLISSDLAYINLFFLLSVFLGFVAVALFIAFLTLLILRGFKKK